MSVFINKLRPDIPLITVIIVTYNSEDCIAACLDSILNKGNHSELQVIVVDNKSNDNTRDIVSSKYPDIDLIASDYNVGFGAGNNIGLLQSKGDYLFILNPDTVLHQNCLLSLMNFLNDNPECAIVGPAITTESEVLIRSSFPFTNLYSSILGAMGLNRLLDELSIKKKLSELTKTPKQVDRLLGAAMFIRKNVFEEVGGFDERFFLYSEEEDLCKRIINAGWEIWYEPSAVAVHLGAHSTRSESVLAITASNWSRHEYLRKHFGVVVSVISAMFWVPALFIRLLISAIAGQPRKIRHGYIMSIVTLIQPGYFGRYIRPKSNSPKNTIS